MGVGTLLIGTAMLLVVVALVLYPLFGDKQTTHEKQSKSERLQRERQQIVHGIRELDHDYRTNKMTDADYQTLRVKLVERGTAILKELDALVAEPVDTVDQEIEQLIKRAREAEPRCPACSRPTVSGAQFCQYCGASLIEPEHVQ
jgi:rRNA maturation endonuclease Nob1